MMLTVSQVAERLQLSESSIYAMVSAGELPAYRVGIGRGRLRIAESALDEYLDGRRRETAGKAPPRPPRPRLKHIKVQP